MRPLLTLLFILASSTIVMAGEKPQPNFLVILCDDLGWGDLENYGHPSIKTPHLMQMAKDGIQFSNCYSAAPVCSPSRVGLLTGRNPNRAGVYDWIPPANPNRPARRSREYAQMRESEFTISRMLKNAGYATCMSGKWHCNAMFNSDQQAQPDDHGFDHWFATQNNASPSHENPKNFVRNGEKVGKIEGYSCQIVADEFIDWLKSHQKSNAKQPFFGYVAFHEPHEPVASPPELVARHESKTAENHDEAQYFANVENVDLAVGKLLAAIDDMGLNENTFVIFTSDNGPETLNRYKSANRSYGTPGPLRGMKLHTHEAGYRVAGIMRWPSTIQAGQESDEVVSSLDFLPTFANLAGAEVPEDLLLDGVDMLPALQGNKLERNNPLLWVYYNSLTENRKTLPSVSLRRDNLKIRAVLKGVAAVQNVDDQNLETIKKGVLADFEIYDLTKDMTESNPLPTEESDLPDLLRETYQSALETFHVWPSVEE